jgi:ankyrin repeat protein
MKILSPIFRFLVEFGCDVNAQDSDGWTPLHCAGKFF